MLTDESKAEWEEYFRKEANELGVKDTDGFVSAAMFGVGRYSLSLAKTIVSYSDSLMNKDVDGDNWITDGSVLMFIQNLKPQKP